MKAVLSDISDSRIFQLFEDVGVLKISINYSNGTDRKIPVLKLSKSRIYSGNLNKLKPCVCVCVCVHADQIYRFDLFIIILYTLYL